MRAFKCVLVIIVLLGLGIRNSSSTKSSKVGPPVILIPGDGGSQIEAKLNKTSVVHYLCEKTSADFFDLWLNLELLVPMIIDCWVDNMRLVYDNVSRTTSNSPGVETRIPGFGNTSTVEWLDPSQASPSAYFNIIANALVDLGYVRGVSVRGAPYDFRRAPNEQKDYFNQLRLLVEETYTANGNQPVVFLTHSMGGVMCLRFLQKQPSKWKKKYIRTMVTLSAPWGGSVKALKVFAVGDNLGVYVVSEGILREEQRTSPSLAWLLPSSLFWKPEDVLVSTADSANFTVKDYEAFFRKIQYPTGWEMRKDLISIAEDFTHPGVEVHCLHGFGVNTIERLHYPAGKFPDGYPTLMYGDGDGTVNIRSLSGCEKWSEKPSGPNQPKVYHQPIPGISHMDILRDNRVLSYLKSLLSEKLT